jgi:hypothetical protein
MKKESDATSLSTEIINLFFFPFSPKTKYKDIDTMYGNSLLSLHYLLMPDFIISLFQNVHKKLMRPLHDNSYFFLHLGLSKSF